MYVFHLRILLYNVVMRFKGGKECRQTIKNMLKSIINCITKIIKRSGIKGVKLERRIKKAIVQQ
jgi:hypothetical protein